MVSVLSARRMTENQAVFRRMNQRVQKYINDVAKVAAEEKQTPPKLDDNTLLYLYCECSDENCRQRLKISLKDYRQAHRANDQFTIAKNHNIVSIENVVDKKPNYWVVKKHLTPPQSPQNLYHTEAHNV